jgi:hypothetical protein
MRLERDEEKQRRSFDTVGGSCTSDARSTLDTVQAAIAEHQIGPGDVG